RGGKTYRRGENLIDLPRDNGIAHGTGAAGVLAGGSPGLTRLVGIAPGAELVALTLEETGQELALTQTCLDEGARVVLHEYAPWVGYHLDGSSELEQLIDETAQEGVAHINPAGNLSTAEKLFKHAFAAGSLSTIPIEAPPDSPYGEFRFLGASFLWRDTGRDLQVALEDPTGFSMVVTTDAPFLYTDWHDGLKVYAVREDSSRGTARLDLYLFSDAPDPPPIPLGTWLLHVTDPAAPGSPDLEIIGYVMDDLSGWGHGIHFPELSSEEHLVGYPGTADLGLAVSATTGHGFNGGEPGTRAHYSGRGHRIDGESILWISAPDDPITSGFWEGREASYVIYGGTSGASPHVAGAAALLLEDDPTRTGADVREAIKAGALVDDAVGAAPNDDYGHGKLRIHRSLRGEDPPGGEPPTISVAPATATVEEEVAIPVSVADPDEPSEGLLIEVDRDYDGTYDARVEAGVLRMTFDRTGQRLMRLRVRDATGREAGALLPIEVLPPRLVAGGGWGCGVGGPGSAGVGAIGLAALLALRRARRARRRGR
ncbi:MAG: S8 family serine peptidase, partial [Polyangiaceae bacterium]|nr:S8 family serine peptidase [Polyangiaceae bacterium]